MSRYTGAGGWREYSARESGSGNREFKWELTCESKNNVTRGEYSGHLDRGGNTSTTYRDSNTSMSTSPHNTEVRNLSSEHEQIKNALATVRLVSLKKEIDTLDIQMAHDRNIMNDLKTSVENLVQTTQDFSSISAHLSSVISKRIDQILEATVNAGQFVMEHSKDPLVNEVAKNPIIKALTSPLVGAAIKSNTHVAELFKCSDDLSNNIVTCAAGTTIGVVVDAALQLGGASMVAKGVISAPVNPVAGALAVVGGNYVIDQSTSVAISITRIVTGNK